MALLPEGKRHEGLAIRFDGLVADLFGSGVYDLTSAAAKRCASIMAHKRSLGESLDDHLPDAMIAGIGAEAGIALATRNRAEFRNCGNQAAMRGALQAGGRAVGVLGDSLASAAVNRENSDLILDEHLLLVSPYDPAAGFNVGNAMQRNKLIYALADAALVVSSDHRKGGTWSAIGR